LKKYIGGIEMKDPIKVLVKKAGQEPTIEIIENDLHTLQVIVGGYIEMPYNPDLPSNLQIVCNEEGKFIENAKPNVRWGDYDVIFGDVLSVGIGSEGETISLTPKRIIKAKEWIAENDASEFT
jgi:hypothetical protein